MRGVRIKVGYGANRTSGESRFDRVRERNGIYVETGEKLLKG